MLEFGEKGESLGELLQTVVQRGDQRNEWASKTGLGGPLRLPTWIAVEPSSLSAVPRAYPELLTDRGHTMAREVRALRQ